MPNWQELKDNPRLKKIYDERIRIVRLVREFFWSQGFAEAETPIAVRYASQEPYLNPVKIKFEDPRSEKFDFYLHTSPEYALKKLLCAGYGKIFEICRCFRNGEEFGGVHNPEFTMLEWYRAPGNYREIMDDVELLFKFVGKNLGVASVAAKGRAIATDRDWDRTSMKELWENFLNADLDSLLDFESIKKFAETRGYAVGPDDKYEDVFFRIFLNDIEPGLGREKPVFIYDYPLQMSSLSRPAKDRRYGERFECYIGGLEICNAFGELTDAGEQKGRLEADRNLRAGLGRETWPVDPEFIAALRAGMPEAGGVALGIDRMVLLFTGAKDLGEVIFGSVGDQIG